MSSIEDLLNNLDDDDFFDVEEKHEDSSLKKRKREDLEDGEIEERKCIGYYFDISVMKKLPGCIDCHNGKYCKRKMV